MSVISTNLTLGTGDYPLNHARILYESIATFDNVIGSSEAAGFPAIAAVNSDTYEYWIPSTMPAVFTVDAGVAKDVDAVGIAAHSFATDNVTITIEYSTDGSTWSGVSTGAFGAQDGTPVLALFDKVYARYWRITFAGSTPPQIGVIYIGEALQMMRPFYGGHTPITLARMTTYIGNKTEGGQTMGTSVIRKGTETSYEWDNLKASWVREKLDPFIVSVCAAVPFFLAWNALQFPKEVGYLYVGEDIRPSNKGVRDLMSVGFTAQGLSDE